MSEIKLVAPKLRFPEFTEDWEQRKLSDVVDFLDTMRKPLESAKREPGPYPYYGASGIVDYVKDYIFDEELVLLSEDGANITDRNYPVCFLADGKYWVNNHAHVLKCKPANENNFICNSLERKDYTKYNSGMAMPKLNQDVCKSIPVMCPSFEEQKKIGDTFRMLDKTIALHQRKLDEMKEYKKGLLQKMFPKDGKTVPEIRFPEFTGDWEQRKFGEVLLEFSNKSKIENEHPILSSTNAGMEPRDGRVSGASNIGYKIIEDGDLVLSPQNLWLGNININNIGTGIVSPSYKTFKVTGIVPDFVLPQLRTPKLMQAYLESSTQGASVVRRNLEMDKFAEIQIATPSVEEQKKIGEFFIALDTSIALHQRKLDAMKEYKKGLLQQMFV